MRILTIAREALTALCAHGEAGYPEEACGGLLGRQEGGRRMVSRAIPVENAARENRKKRYEVAPGSIERLEKEARQSGLMLLGFYHSHPDHPSRPSRHDLEQAWPWYSYLIVSVKPGDVGEITSWELAEDRSGFHMEKVEVLEPEKIHGKEKP